MAITGLVVTFGSILANSIQGVTSAPIYGPASGGGDTLTVAGMAGGAAPQPPKAGFIPMVSLYAAADWYVTIGKNPTDPSVATSGRRAIPAGKTVDIFCDIGDKVRGFPSP